MEEDGDPERDEAEEGGGGGEADDGEGEGEILFDDGEVFGGFVEEPGEEMEVVVEEDDVGGVDGGGAADAAHRDADGGAGEGGGVVDPVADHGEAPCFGEFGDFVEFVFGAKIGVDFVDAEHVGDGLGVLGIVAGEHDGAEGF